MSEHVRLRVDHRLWLISPCSSEGLAAAFLPYCATLARLRPPLVRGPSGEADVLQPCSPGEARAAAVH
jgi:hypothetical protein